MQYERRKIQTQDYEHTPIFSNNICFTLRNTILDEISKNLLVNQPKIFELSEKIREDFCFYPMTKHESFNIVAGVDAGSQILPLAAQNFGIISALCYQLPSGKIFYLPPETIIFSKNLNGINFKNIINIRREAKLYETAKSYLENYPETELLVIDGPLVFSDWWLISGNKKDKKRLISAIENLLLFCKNANVIIAGIVKRPSARYLMYHLGLDKETCFSDSYLLLHTLNPGERTDLFSPQLALNNASRKSVIMDAVGVSIYSFYARMSKEWSIPPIRIDVPNFCLGYLDDIADYCYSSSLYDGIPLPIIKADEEVKITRRFMSEVYSEILTRVSRKKGELRQLAPYWGEGKWMGV
ncbi:DNA double-strand break repair nuclease NurA [Candidatus Bathyarchaeota archaeon]|nr:DNA double-strand break repair nuclease NurA [Candidatus Bathyarchaeota archaeon]